MWIGDWFLIKSISDNKYHAVHKYYINSENTYSINHTQLIEIYDNPGNLINISERDYERFWSKVDTTNNIDDCWDWTAGLLKCGYGQFKTTFMHSPIGAHRFSYQLYFGPIPFCHIKNWDYHEVMHLCNNPKCVNPTHLELGDTSLNGKYMAESKRSLSNELNSSCKYSDKLILEIFERVSNDTLLSVNAIQSEYNMTFSEVHALFDNRIRSNLKHDYDLKKLKKKICFTRLTVEEVNEIKKLLKQNVQISYIASKFNKSLSAIYGIKNNRYYTNI